MEFDATSATQRPGVPRGAYAAFSALFALLTWVLAVGIAAPISYAVPASGSHELVVSGASGQLGGEVVDALLARGVPAKELILVSRTPEKLARYSERGANVRFGDFDRPDSLESAFGGGNRLLLISTNAMPPRRPDQHLAAIEAAKRAGIRQIIYTSMAAADRIAKVGVLQQMIRALSQQGEAKKVLDRGEVVTRSVDCNAKLDVFITDEPELKV